MTDTKPSRPVTEPQYGGWCNHETQCIANEVFGSRQTFFFVKEVMGEGKNLNEKANILSELMTQWLGKDGFEEEGLFAWNRVNWKQIAQEIMTCAWGIGTP